MRIEWRAGDRASSTAVRNLHLGVVELEPRALALHAVEKVGARPAAAARPRDVNSANEISQYTQNSFIEVE